MIYIDGEPIEDWMKRKFEEGLRKILGTTDLEDIKPIGLYENSEEVLRTLEKLYNDFTMRPDECKALDWAIRFIKEHTEEGAEK